MQVNYKQFLGLDLATGIFFLMNILISKLFDSENMLNNIASTIIFFVLMLLISLKTEYIIKNR